MKTANTRQAWSRSALIVILSLVPVILSSQSIWVNRADSRCISFEMLKPNFKHDDSKLAKYAFFLSLHVPIADSARLVFELPLAYAAYQDYDYDYVTYQAIRTEKSETAVGNPYLGVETSVNANVFWEMGLRIPLSPEDKPNALMMGMFTDFDRVEAFSHDLLPLQISLNFRHRDASGVVMRLRGGPDLWIRTDTEGDDDKTDLLMHYSAQLGYEGERLNFLVGVTGKALLSESDLDFGERSFHQLGINAGVNLGRFTPGLFARFPLDEDLSDLLNNVIGINCSFQIK